MKLKIFLIAILLAGSHLLVSSNDYTGVATCGKAGKLQKTVKQSTGTYGEDADTTVLGISPLNMLLHEI